MPGNPHTRPVARVSEEHKQRWLQDGRTHPRHG
jgi:hypothetical protein